MKKLNLINTCALLILCGGLALSSCKKKETTNPATTDESGQSGSDNRNAQSENETAVNDINNVIGDQNALSGRSSENQGAMGVMGNICGASVDTTGMKAQGTVKINYDGTTCNNRTRTGSIKLTIQNYTVGKRWKQAGCVIKVDYLAYKIKRASDGKFIQLDGTQFLTNESGGTWVELLILKNKTSLVSTVTGTNLKATFEDGKTATYNINRRFTYTYPNNVLTLKGEGIGSNGGLNNLENFGTTRDGDAFTSQVNVPIIWNLTCGPWAPVQGDVFISVVGKGFDLHCTYAVDQSGNPVSVSANQCAYGWKLEWTINGKTNNKVFGYN